MNITIPSVGESITEGTVARWLKKDGDQVAQGEPLYELETDKATTEVPAPESGVLHISVAEGKTVAVGATIGTLDASPDGDGKKKPKATASRTKPEEGQPLQDRQQPEVPKGEPKPAEEPAEVPQIDRVAAASPAPEVRQPPAKEDQDERREPMSPIRQRIAQRLLASRQTTATLTTFNEADLAALESMRTRYRERFQEKHGVKLGLMSFFVKACVQALEALPIVNARIDGSDVVYHRHCHIGVAISTEKGLFVPVLRHAESMSFAQIEKTIAQLAEKARQGTISIQDLQNGTFTITNGGVFGSLFSTPILNPPQSAILGMHAVQKRPIVVNDEIVVRPMMYLALSYDHRLIDGREAVKFLAHVKQSVEKPESMLLEI